MIVGNVTVRRVNRRVGSDSAFSTFEFVSVIVILMALGLGIFDLMNFIRAGRVVEETAVEAAERFRNVDINGIDPHDSGSKYNQALQMATDLLTAGLPAAKFNCNNSEEVDCASISMHVPILREEAVVVTVSYTIPVTVLAGAGHVVTRTVSRRMQSTYKAIAPMHITTDHY